MYLCVKGHVVNWPITERVSRASVAMPHAPPFSTWQVEAGNFVIKYRISASCYDYHTIIWHRSSYFIHGLLVGHIIMVLCCHTMCYASVFTYCACAFDTKSPIAVSHHFRNFEINIYDVISCVILICTKRVTRAVFINFHFMQIGWVVREIQCSILTD